MALSLLTSCFEDSYDCDQLCNGRAKRDAYAVERLQTLYTKAIVYEAISSFRHQQMDTNRNNIKARSALKPWWQQ